MDGSEARRRLSFSTLPSLTGTLKSTRMITRLPLRSRSSMKSLAMVLALILPCPMKKGRPYAGRPQESRGDSPGPAQCYFAPSFFAM